MEEKDRGKCKKRERKMERGREREWGGKAKSREHSQTAAVLVVRKKYRRDINGQTIFFDLSPMVLLHRTILWWHNGLPLISAGI